jgi:hypothetical protein
VAGVRLKGGQLPRQAGEVAGRVPRHVLRVLRAHLRAEHPTPEGALRPHACNDGWVTISQLVVDPETGEETEEFALCLCRKCAERS